MRQDPGSNPSSTSSSVGTAVACHMAKISYREKRRVAWDAAKLTLSPKA